MYPGHSHADESPQSWMTQDGLATLRHHYSRPASTLRSMSLWLVRYAQQQFTQFCPCANSHKTVPLRGDPALSARPLHTCMCCQCPLYAASPATSACTPDPSTGIRPHPTWTDAKPYFLSSSARPLRTLSFSSSCCSAARIASATVSCIHDKKWVSEMDPPTVAPPARSCSAVMRSKAKKSGKTLPWPAGSWAWRSFRSAVPSLT